MANDNHIVSAAVAGDGDDIQWTSHTYDVGRITFVGNSRIKLPNDNALAPKVVGWIVDGDLDQFLEEQHASEMELPNDGRVTWTDTIDADDYQWTEIRNVDRVRVGLRHETFDAAMDVFMSEGDFSRDAFTLYECENHLFVLCGPVGSMLLAPLLRDADGD